MYEVDRTRVLDDEMSFIGAALIRDDVVDTCSAWLKPSHFENGQLAQIWQTMMAARADNKTSALGELVALGCNVDTLERCNQQVATHLGFETYAKKIKEAAARRQVIGAVNAIRDICTSEALDEGYQSQLLDILVRSLDADDARQDTFALKQSAKEALHNAMLALHSGNEVSGLSVGIDSVDRMTGGLGEGELVILAGRPGMGKSTFALNIARHVCATTPTAFFSLEMPHEQLGRKMLAYEAGISSTAIKTGMIRNREADLQNAVKAFGDLQFTIFDKPDVTLGYMRSKLHQLQAKSGKPVGLIVVDYLQLMTGDTRNGRVQEIGGLSRGLKVLAKDFACPVIALSQLNRQCEQRENKRPLMGDLRDSGSIEQDADHIWFVYRDCRYNDMAPKDAAELIISKQREGSVGTIPLTFDGALSKFAEPRYEDMSLAQAQERMRRWQQD